VICVSFSYLLTGKQNTTYIMNKTEKRKTALANKASYAPVWYAFYDLRPGNRAGPILIVAAHTWGKNYDIYHIRN